MNTDVEKQLKEAREILQSEFNTLIEDGQLIGMRNLRLAFQEWVQRLRKKTGEELEEISVAQVELFMSEFIEELEKTVQKQRSDNGNLGLQLGTHISDNGSSDSDNVNMDDNSETEG